MSSDRNNKREHKLSDVADLAGVSAATVSRVITRPYMVSDAVRVKVQQAIETLGYQPLGKGKRELPARSRSVGVVVPTLDIAAFAVGVSALQTRLSHEGIMLQLAISNFSASQEIECVRGLLRSGVNGLVMVGTRHDSAVYELLDREGVPFVNTWDFVEEDTRPCIGFDNHQAAQHIARYVLDAGHREIAIIAGGGPQRSDRSVARLQGALQALQKRGVDVPADRILELPYIMQAGGSAIRKLLEQKTPPTAVICTNDILAVGALLEAQRQGVKVPEQLSFTGFDDLNISSLVSPGLTTIHVPAQQMGILSAEYLLERMAGRNPLHRVKLDYSLIVRASVAQHGNGSPDQR